jgi:transposase/IS5 family transposase
VAKCTVESRMAHISGSDRSQLLLLPEAIDDYVGTNNPVRFIDAFVDGIDLKAAGFERVEAKATGRPGYAPGDLLKLYIYGYLNQVRSSRRLEAECHRNIEVIWLLRTLKPDFKTIADFRADNRAAFKRVFREFVVLCKRLNLFGRELLAVDGTRIKAVNNKDRNFTRASLAKFIKAADERLDDYLKRLDEGDVAESGTQGARVRNLADKIAALRDKRDRYGAMLANLERSGEDQISLTDPDSRAMAAHTRVAVGYNVQVAVDAKNKLIVEQAVTNQVVDMGLLKETAEPAREILDVETIDVVADRGYFKSEDIEACEKAGLTPHVPRPQRGPAVANGFFRKDEFRYDAARDAYICPAGLELKPIRRGRLRDMQKVDYANAEACRDCPLRPRCTNADYRAVSRLENEDALDRMAVRLRQRPDILARRQEIVEHPFGTIKQWMNQGAFLTRGLDKVRAEFSLTALAYNMRRALNILSVEKLMDAIAT